MAHRDVRPIRFDDDQVSYDPGYLVNHVIVDNWSDGWLTLDIAAVQYRIPPFFVGWARIVPWVADAKAFWGNPYNPGPTTPTFGHADVTYSDADNPLNDPGRNWTPKTTTTGPVITVVFV